MILELAKQSIETKLKLKSSLLLGNYEFYYSVGILCREIDLQVPEDIKPLELHDFIRTNTDGKKYDSPTATHLLKMIHFYKPDEEYDTQMKELLEWGKSGNN